MNRKLLLILAFFFSLSLLITITDAHIPKVPDDGTTLGTATEVIDPWKSWFYYSELDAGEIHYYSFDATEGDRIRFMLNVPIQEGDRGFTPGLVLMGPNVTDQGAHPTGLEIPVGAGVMVIPASPLEPEYEGFTPISQYNVVNLNMSAPATGTYYIGVYEESTSGRYAFVTGYVEVYTLVSWILVPPMAMTIIMWTGQSLLLVLLPMLLPLILGLIFLLVRRRSAIGRENVLSLIGTIGGLLILGSSFSFAYQMTLSLIQAPFNWTAIVSMIFIITSLLLGIAVLRIVHGEDWESKRSQEISLIAIGFIALFVWAGIYIGPIFVIVAGLFQLFK
ncbi:MAG: hypothetical protein ACFFE7_13905 [Candidatus Thorarchaeota archaeon]